MLNQIIAQAINRFGARIHVFCWTSNHLDAIGPVDVDDYFLTPLRYVQFNPVKEIQTAFPVTGLRGYVDSE